MPGDTRQPAGEWISVESFSPGIHEDFFAASGGGFSNLRNGAATRSGTYRCIADPISGMLTPLPRAVAGSTQSPVGTASSGNYPAANIAMYVTDALVVSPVVTFPGSPAADPDAVHVMWGFTYDNDGGGDGYRPYLLGREYRIFSSGTRDVAFEKGNTNVTPPIALSPGAYDRGLLAASSGFGIASDDAPTLMMLHQIFQGGATSGAIPAADQALTTYDTDVSANFRATTSAVGRTSNNDSSFTTSNNTGMLMIAHQGRMVTFGTRAPYEQVNYSSNVGQALDRIFYTAVRSFATGTAVSYMEENQSGFGAVVSMTADQLLVIKHHGGGYLVRGSLSAPNVVRLPFLQSTEGVCCRPVATPIGVVYGARNGVHLYSGGDSSQSISPQIDGDFWRIKNDTTNEFYEGIESRFEWWNPYVLVGNNWLFDTRTQSWWRLDIPSDYSDRPFSHYSMSAGTGKLYAFPYKVTSAADTAWYTFARDTLALTYKWTSQPLIESRDEMMKYEEVEIIAQRPTAANGACTVTVTLTGINHLGATVMSTPVVFDLSTSTADRPTILRKNIAGAGSTTAFTARYVQVVIDASSNAGAAPKVAPPRVWARVANSMPSV